MLLRCYGINIAQICSQISQQAEVPSTFVASIGTLPHVQIHHILLIEPGLTTAMEKKEIWR